MAETNKLALAQPKEQVQFDPTRHKPTPAMRKFTIAYLENYTNGISPNEACRQAGISISNYQRWKQRYPWFFSWFSSQFETLAPNVIRSIAQVASNPEHSQHNSTSKLFLQLCCNWSERVDVQHTVQVLDPGNDILAQRLSLARQLQDDTTDIIDVTNSSTDVND